MALEGLLSMVLIQRTSAGMAPLAHVEPKPQIFGYSYMYAPHDIRSCTHARAGLSIHAATDRSMPSAAPRSLPVRCMCLH